MAACATPTECCRWFAIGQESGFDTAYVPAADAREAAVVRGITVYPVDSLQQLVAHFNGLIQIEPHVEDSMPETEAGYGPDVRDIRGQEHAKRALEVSAAGGHNVAMIGPPGTGKTLLARAMPSILPPLTSRNRSKSPRSTAWREFCRGACRW